MVVLVEDSVFVPGDDVVVLVVLLLELEAPAGEGFTIVVLVSFLSVLPPAGVVTSVLCSQAANSAALARMQMYFFIVWMGCPVWVKADSDGRRVPALPHGIFLALRSRSKRRLVGQTVRFRDRFLGQAPIAGVDSTGECRLLFARPFQAEIRQQFHIASRRVA